MRLTVGLILMMAGGVVVLVGIYLGLAPLIEFYQSNLADPLNQPEGAEKSTSEAMFRGLMIGAAGAVPFLIGTVMVKRELYRKLRARK